MAAANNQAPWWRLASRFRWIHRLISANAGAQTITAVDPEAIYEMLRDKIKGQLDVLDGAGAAAARLLNAA